MICIYIIVITESQDIIHGIGLLEKVPDYYECLRTLPNGDLQPVAEWKPCKKEEICDEGLDKDHYRPVRDDTYLDNWVDNVYELCEPKYKVGLIGSAYFVGVIISVATVPPLADAYGRKYLFIGSVCISIIAQLIFCFCHNITELYFLECVIGLSFGGRVVVGFSYLLEYLPMQIHNDIIFLVLIIDNVWVAGMTFYY